MKILPCASKGIVLLHGDGKTAEMAPLHVFRLKNGWTCVRIGRNVLMFDETGQFDGEECSVPEGGVPAEQLVKMLEESAANSGHLPEDVYFDSGTTGFDAEMASRDMLVTQLARSKN